MPNQEALKAADDVAENQYKEMIFFPTKAATKGELALIAIACELRAARIADRERRFR